MAENKTLRARPSIFRRTDAGIPELDGANSQPANRSAGWPAKPPRIKATFYLTADDIVAIDTMQTAEFRRTGKKPERSELVSRAIQELFRQHRDPPAE